MSSTGGTEGVLQQVNQFWSMLDDLSQNDPAAYRRFIHKQMEEGAELMAPPELDSSLCTEILEPNKGLLYINICSWKRVPAPQDPSKPLPLCAGKLETDTDESQASQTPAALLQQICSLRSEKQDVELEAQIISRPAEHKKDLIQVISTTFVQPQKPEYQLRVKIDTAGVPRSVELTVELPKVCSVSECQLRISKDDVLLEVEDVYFLLLEFPKTVNEDTASAIFNKKKRRLALTVDVL
ncbi:PIH1 domain-containing protein 2 isoform X2 [Seriola dumerili]|uniref:PIH1 domain-containing protein 2 isoform X2 n=1 Tax=Seriola dumerili TaxID=41447 RepID=UPI000BBF166F|nr:PIH1 domain-containing protein 2 isoform X2 [Seriola dumerili]